MKYYTTLWICGFSWATTMIVWERRWARKRLGKKLSQKQQRVELSSIGQQQTAIIYVDEAWTSVKFEWASKKVLEVQYLKMVKNSTRLHIKEKNVWKSESEARELFSFHWTRSRSSCYRGGEFTTCRFRITTPHVTRSWKGNVWINIWKFAQITVIRKLF